MSTCGAMDERHVPLIDYSQSDEEAAQQLYKALSTVGFACFTNTGLWDLVSQLSIAVVKLDGFGKYRLFLSSQVLDLVISFPKTVIHYEIKSSCISMLNWLIVRL